MSFQETGARTSATLLTGEEEKRRMIKAGWMYVALSLTEYKR